MTGPRFDATTLADAVTSAFDPDRGALLDAALGEFAEHGLRRTSVSDIARRAGVSRMTINRKLGDKDAIAVAVVAREAMRILNRLQEQVRTIDTASDRLVEIFAVSILEAHEHPLVKALLNYEPDTVHAMMTSSNSPPFTSVREVIVDLVADDTLPAQDAREAVDVALRIAVMLLIAPSDVTPVDTYEQAVAFGRKYLAAVLNAARVDQRT